MSNISRSIYCFVLLTAVFVCTFALRAQTISTFAGGGSSLGDGGPATSGKLSSPTGIAIDGAGNIYVADMGNNRIRMVNPSGIITTVAGGGVGGDGGPAVAAALHQPAGVYVDAAGNIYIAEMASSGGNRIRMVNTGGIISTIAGTGSASFSGDTGPATLATLNKPSGVTVDPSGNVYIADWGNNRVRKVNTSGIITTIAGGGSVLGDGGPAVSAMLNNPYSVSLDIAGDLFISDEHNYRLRKIDPAGIITTVAGNGIGGGIGDGSPATAAEFNQPDGIVADAGTLYIADYSNNRVRSVDLTTGICNTAAGTGTPGLAGDGFAATTAELNSPSGVVLDPNGNIYISDLGNNRIRKVSINNHLPVFTGGHLQHLVTCENTVGVPVDSLLAVQDTDIGQKETWVLFSPPLHGTATVAYTATSADDTLLPTGLTYTPTTGYFGNDTFRVKVDDHISIDTTTIVVTVNPLPHPDPIAGSSTGCVGYTTTLTDDTLGGIWSSSNTTAAISGSGVVSALYKGIDTITYSVTNACGNTRITKTITIDSFPLAGVITGPSSVCVGAIITLSDTVAGGSWGVVTGNAIVFSGVVKGLALGADTITYSVTNACGTARTTHAVIMTSSVPTTNPITGPTSVFCAGTSITLSETTTGGIWACSNGNATISGGVVTGKTGGMDTISYIVTNSCGTAHSNYVVTIEPLPNAGNILGLSYACEGHTVTLADGAGGGAWSSLNTAIATVTPTGIVKAIAAGTDYIIYTVSNACGSASARYFFTVMPAATCVSGIPNLAGEGKLSIHPNPSFGSFTVEIPQFNGSATILISDMYGRTVETRQTDISVNTFDLGSISAGTYIIKVQSADVMYADKIILW